MTRCPAVFFTVTSRGALLVHLVYIILKPAQRMGISLFKESQFLGSSRIVVERVSQDGL